MPIAPPPRTIEELCARADALSGRTLGDVARERYAAVPPDLRRAKGWIGNLIEEVLGATSGSRAQPDFPHLGVELKTLPVDERGVPSQATFVCTAPPDLALHAPWSECWLRAKLARVLWVPIVGGGPVGERIVGTPVLWSPSPGEEEALRADWEELAGLMARGELWQVTGRRGVVLQLRPKAADGAKHTWALDDEGAWVRDTPRAFYLRPRFTGALLRRYLLLPGR